MKKLSWLIALAMMISLIFVGPVYAGSDNGSGGEPMFSIMSVAPITIGADWSDTMVTPPAFFWDGGDDVFSSSGPFTFDAVGPVRVDVTDTFNSGDVFEIFDNDVSIGSTSFVTPTISSIIDPETAFANSAYSHGSFDLGAGSHSITIKVTENPFGAGRGYLRVMYEDDSIGPEPGLDDRDVSGFITFEENQPTVEKPYAYVNDADTMRIWITFDQGVSVAKCTLIGSSTGVGATVAMTAVGSLPATRFYRDIDIGTNNQTVTARIDRGNPVNQSYERTYIVDNTAPYLEYDGDDYTDNFFAGYFPQGTPANLDYVAKDDASGFADDIIPLLSDPRSMALVTSTIGYRTTDLVLEDRAGNSKTITAPYYVYGTNNPADILYRRDDQSDGSFEDPEIFAYVNNDDILRVRIDFTNNLPTSPLEVKAFISVKDPMDNEILLNTLMIKNTAKQWRHDLDISELGGSGDGVYTVTITRGPTAGVAFQTYTSTFIVDNGSPWLGYYGLFHDMATVPTYSLIVESFTKTINYKVFDDFSGTTPDATPETPLLEQTKSVTLNAPAQTGTGTKTQDLEEIDQANNLSTFHLRYQILTLEDFMAMMDPIKEGGEYNAGRTIPIKLGIRNGMEWFFLGGPDLTFTLDASKWVEEDWIDQPITKRTANPDGLFRLNDWQYIYNLSTKGWEPGQYKIDILMDSPYLDGEFEIVGTVEFTLR